jgi:hypothetical protein
MMDVWPTALHAQQALRTSASGSCVALRLTMLQIVDPRHNTHTGSAPAAHRTWTRSVPVSPQVALLATLWQKSIVSGTLCVLMDMRLCWVKPKCGDMQAFVAPSHRPKAGMQADLRFLGLSNAADNVNNASCSCSEYTR